VGREGEGGKRRGEKGNRPFQVKILATPLIGRLMTFFVEIIGMRSNFSTHLSNLTITCSYHIIFPKLTRMCRRNVLRSWFQR